MTTLIFARKLSHRAIAGLTCLAFALFIALSPGVTQAEETEAPPAVTQVNINTADAATISAELNGIGLSKAEAIVEYRKKHGPFKSVDDLSLVKGIGEKTVEKNRHDIRVSDSKK